MAGGLQGEAKGSAAFIPRKAFCLAYVQVLNTHRLLCVGIALNSACKLRLAQKSADGLVRGFNPWVRQLKAHTGFLLVFFNFTHFIVRQVPGNFLRSSLLLCHTATDAISRDDRAEPPPTKKAIAAGKTFSGRSTCFGNRLPWQPEGSQPCLVRGNAHWPLPAFGKGGGLADAISALSLEGRLSPEFSAV